MSDTTREALERMLTLKQNDWIESCGEIDQLKQKLAESEKEVARLTGFCSEFVFIEANPLEWESEFQKLNQKLSEEIQRGLAWKEKAEIGYEEVLRLEQKLAESEKQKETWINECSTYRLMHEKSEKNLSEALEVIHMAPRFWSKVKVIQGACWEWLGSISPNGYGKFSINNSPHSAHVVSWKMFNGEYESGLFIDHQCKNRKCVNPKHLRLVTPKVNSLENSNSVSAKNLAKTACSQGHNYTPENTLMKTKHGKSYRKCRICLAEDNRKRKEKRDFLEKHEGKDGIS